MAAALFVLQAPLCLLACLPSADAAPMDAAKHGSCHEDAPSDAPSAPTHSHEDCGCEDSQCALVLSADQSLSNIFSLVSPLPSLRADGRSTSSRWVQRAQPKETDLPPPDVLLLKSTLLI